MRQLTGCIAALGMAVLLAATMARAGDAARLELLGFSADGRHFALVQSGIEDGSGRPYAHLDIVPAADGAPPGERISAVLDEGRTVAEARSALTAMAAARLAALGLPHEAAAGPAVGQPLPDASSIGLTLADGRAVDVHVRREPYDSPACARFGVQAFGVALELRTQARVLAQKTWRPAGDECPVRFGPATVRSHLRPDGTTAVAAVMAYERLGFEGADLRFLPLILTLGPRR